VDGVSPLSRSVKRFRLGKRYVALMPLHNASWKLKRALDRWPRASWRIARTQLLWKTVERLLHGELSAPGEQHGIARIPLRALEVLGRT